MDCVCSAPTYFILWVLKHPPEIQVYTYVPSKWRSYGYFPIHWSSLNRDVNLNVINHKKLEGVCGKELYFEKDLGHLSTKVGDFADCQLVTPRTT